MDILSPQLIWIGKRCYRINPTLEMDTKNEGKYTNPYTEEDLYDDNEQDEYEIEQTDGNRFKNSFHVPQLFYAQIIGAKGMTRRRIEAETKSQIKVPKPGVQGDIVVIGPTRKSVAAARRRIEIIVIAGRNKQQFTHFISIPFTSPEIKTSFESFRNSILTGKPIYGLDSSLFQNANKLHLTIGTLSLMDNDDRANAAQYLQDCRETIIAPILQQYCGRVDMKMTGIEYMNDDPGAVDVLYGKVECDPLQKIADGIAEYFVQKGLTQKKYDHVKLHVTLINSMFRDEMASDGGDGGEGAASKKRTTFDARDILATYENYYFGGQELREIHLSQRYSTGSNGFYEATGLLKVE